MDKRPLNPFEQQCYDLFLQGCTVHDINRRLKVRTDCIVNARYKIMEKGYTLPKLETPSTEIPDDIEFTKEIMRAMNEKEKRRILTDEERQQIIEEVGAGMSQKECAKKYNLHPSTVCNVIKQHRQTLAEQANPEPEEVPEETLAPESEPAEQAEPTPRIIVLTVREKLKEVEKCISLSEQILANAREDRAALTAWLEVHDAEL